MPDSPRTDRAVASSTSPAVLAPISINGVDLGSSVIEAVAAAGAGATGIDLSIRDPLTAVESGLAVADELADTSGLHVYLRAAGPLAPGRHTRICPPGSRSSERSEPRASRPLGDCIVDLGIDRVGLPPAAIELASYWPADGDRRSGDRFMISTLGFEAALDAEVMALATLASLRGAVAITTDRIRIVRRVVDTMAAVLDARGAA